MPLTLQSVDSKTIGAYRSFMQLFLHEMSIYRPDEVDEEGRFPHEHLDKMPDDRTSLLLIRVKGHLAGFAVIHLLDDGVQVLSSFFILNAYRGLGIGREAAELVFDQHPGRWIVLAMETSTPAKTFWRRVIRAYTHRQYSAEPDPERGALAFHFTSSSDWAASDPGFTAFQA